jgi:hypothetical protein
MHRTDNQSIFNTENWASKMARFLAFSATPFRGVFRTPGAHSAPAAKRHIHLRVNKRTLAVSRRTIMRKPSNLIS